jgi:hypothetical protein
VRKPIGLAIAGALVASGVAFVSQPGTASAGPGDGKLTVKLVRDVNGNGTHEPALEVGVQGIPVTVTDPAGGTATGSTGADGSVEVNLGSVKDGKYRVEATIPQELSYLKPAPAGTGLSSLTEFVNVAGNTNVTVTMGVWNPADYCQANPTLVTGCQRATRDQEGSSNVSNGSRSLVTFPFTQRGSTAPTKLADQGATGTVYGLAYRKQDKRIFAGAFAKRLTDYGPEGSGAIYVQPASGGTPSLFTKVPNPGNAKHAHQTNFDGGFYAVPGTQGLGDLDVSEDGSELYAVNLNDKKLYVYDATAATAAAPKGSYDIPSPCPADWRPGALGVRDGQLYVGGVCSAQSTKQRSDLKAVVYTFSGGTFSGPVLTKSLDFQRGQAFRYRPNSNVWYPWSDSFGDTDDNDNSHQTYPMPLLTDIGIENNGDLVLAFRDRHGDMAGYNLPAPDGSGGNWETIAGGDLNRACRQAGGYAWEGTSGCPNNHTAGNGGLEPAEVVEYYPGEYYANPGFPLHMETAQGALALVYGQQRMPAIVMDPVDIRSGGVGWFDRTTGDMYNDQHTNGYQISRLDKDAEGWSKANGLADLEALCDLAPVQIGNRVWFDTDTDGVQDGDEPAVAGVKVTATPCAGGAALPVKTTSAKGEYYFTTADGLKPDTCYSLKFDYSAVNTANLPGGPSPGSLKWTAKEAGPSRTADSNVDTAGVATVTIGGAGSVDHTIDAGITAPPKVPVPAGCTGGIVTNPSVEQVSGSTPTGFTKVGPGTLSGEGTYAHDGQRYAWLSSPQNQVTTAYQDVQPAVPGGVYDLAFWGGTHNPQFSHITGVRFLDASGAVLEEKSVQVDHDVDPTGKLQRYDINGSVAPAGTAKVRFFASANGDYNKFDCVYLRVAAYDVLKEVQNPAGQWLDADGDAGTAGSNDNKPASLAPGATAKYRVTVTNVGTQPLSNITPADPWCPLTGVPFNLAPGAKQELTCDHAGVTLADNGHVNTVTVSKVTYPQGSVPDKSEKARIEVLPAYRLGDYVWIDQNRNGLQDAGEPAVPDVTVTLRKADNTVVGAPIKTDANGKYLFDKLPDGSYKVCFDLAAMPAAVADFQATQTNAGDDGKDSDADPATGCTEPVTLDVNSQENLTLDLGLVSPLNRLGDFVWVDTNKNGLQDADEPVVPGVSVVAKNADGAEVGSDTTDDTGKYFIENLPDGTYTVCFGLKALPAAFADYQATQANAGTDNAKDSDADPATGCTEPVELGQGKRENYTLDAGLVSPPNRLGDFVWVDTNKNGVQDSGEPGVPDVPVVVKNADNVEVGSTTTDGTGMYKFDNLPDGKFTVCFGLSALPAAVADYQATQANTGTDDAADSDADPASGCTEPVELGPGKRENLTVDAGLVSPINKLGDFVWIDLNKNGLQDADEPGVEGVSVVAKNAAGAEVGTATTDDKGKYLIDNLPDGTYSVCFGTSALPAAVADYQATQANTGTDNAVDSDADAAGCTETVDLGIGKRENLTLDAGLVSPPNRLGDFVWVDTNKNGVQDPDEPGVPDVSVVVKNADGVEVGTATTDGNGKYAVENLPDGKFTVCFGLKALPAAYVDYQTTQANAGSDDAADSDADPATGCTEPVELGPGKRENLTVDAGIISPTNRLGDFVWVDVNKNGLQDDGEPVVEGVSVVAKNADGAEVGTDTTDDKGQYFIENLPDGTYFVCFGLKSLPAAYADFQATQANAGTDDGLDSDADPTTGCTESVKLGVGIRENLKLDAGIVSPLNKLGDRVWVDLNKNGLQDDGEPGVPDVTVVVKDANNSEVTSTTTDGTGMYKFDILPDGTYTVCFGTSALPAAYADYQVTTRNAGTDDAADSDADPASGCAEPVELGPGKRENLTVDAGIVRPTNKLGDFVWIDMNKNGLQDADEPVVPGVSVVAKNAAGAEVGTATTDDKGKYLIDNLPDGAFIVCFGLSNLPAAVADYKVTQANAGTDDAIDSDADADGCTEAVELGVGKRENYTLDAGLVSPPNRLGDLVWVDSNRDGVQDSGEPGVPDVSVVVKNADGVQVGTATTDGNGKYVVENLPDGSFTVCFGLSALPAVYADYQVTKPNAGEEATDSDADPATGCTEPVNLGPGNRENLTIDAGIVSPTNKLGDYVWIDSNANGLQDTGEPGVDGVTVVLRSGDTDVATTKTGGGGKYLFDELKDGSYRVCFDVKALPAAVADYKLTDQDAGNNNGTDSDAGVDGCTETVSLGVGKRENLTLDAGLVAPPNSLGDFVWVDTNRNGLQDPDEPGADEVTVVLRSGDTEVARMETDPSGKYLFDGLPDGSYRVCFEVASLPVEYGGYLLTSLNAGADGVDSDADPVTGCTEPVSLGVGQRENLTLDAGIRPPNKLGDRVWVDTNGNGLQDPDEPGVPGVSVTLKKEDGTVVGTIKTDNSGKYGFDKLPDGSYIVCFDRATLPAKYADYQLTKPGAGDPELDSDADPSTWCIPPTKLYVGHPEYQSLDAGIVAPRNRLGDYVWIDANRDGVQDPGEAPAAGVPVVLLDGSGKEVGQTSTNPSGKYLFDGLPDGTYQVCFRGKLPAALAEYALTKASAGPDAADSDADPATGCTRKVTVGPSQREILVLDAGLIAPQPAPAPAPKPRPGLPGTGANILWLITLGLLTLTLGAFLVITTRRRRRREPQS